MILSPIVCLLFHLVMVFPLTRLVGLPHTKYIKIFLCFSVIVIHYLCLGISLIWHFAEE